MSNPADLLSAELAERLERVLGEVDAVVPGGPQGFAHFAARSNVGIVDTKRARAWIDEKVYEGALRRGQHWRDLAEARAPIPMILFCPLCGERHIDQPAPPEWTNPPHRSHLCASCGHIWRPADVATVGVRDLETRGKLDQPPPPSAGKAGRAFPFANGETFNPVSTTGGVPTGVETILPTKPSSEPGLFAILRAMIRRPANDSAMRLPRMRWTA